MERQEVQPTTATNQSNEDLKKTASEKQEREILAQRKLLDNYRDHLIKVIEGNTDRFEKQLSYISAGALAISMAFIKDIVGSLKLTHDTGLLLAGWIAMGVTLFINLISQVYANYCHGETIGEIDENCYNSVTATQRRAKIQYMNYFSIATLLFGIGLLLLFISKNL